MPMTGEQKRAYQKEYMRQKRAGLIGSNTGLTDLASGLSLPRRRSRVRISSSAPLRLKIYNNT
jgi:hypothetical protein